ncbi:MAG: PepSY-associated TM helix domain-containing protein [Erythrobacter sp.]|uniref:PepSY-associated TM helix domain-containing protein n=1 Tax=Erythrobacter sp. TaxID=1042 RepID=UPI003265977C
MVDKARHIRIYDLHSWTGVALGIMMFFVAFTGSLALFHHEVEPWEDEARRGEITSTPVPVQPILIKWLEENAQGREPTFVSINLPHGEHGHFDLFASFRDENDEFEQVRARFSSKSGEELQWREEGANQLIYDLHRDLAWPDMLGGRTAGRVIVGLVGIAFLLLILSGIIAHTKITKELFTLRYLKSVRLKWQDSHKVLGLWSSPFAAMIALTGAFLGVVAILLPLVAFVTMKGDQKALEDALGLGLAEPAGISAPMLSVDTPELSNHAISGNPLAFAQYINWGDQNSTLRLVYESPKGLLGSDTLIVDAVTGEALPDADLFTSGGSPFGYVLATFSPLHYGTYGGIALKLIYFALGLALAVMAALGNMMWLERRRHGGEGGNSDRFYAVLSGLNTGVCAGLPLACIWVLAFDKVFWGSEAARYSSVAWFFFSAWILAASFGYWRGNDYKANRELLAVTGFGLAALAPLNWIVTGDMMWNAFDTGADGSAWFDLAFIVLGASVVLTAVKLPSDRPADKRRQAQVEPSVSDFEPQPAE